MDVLYCGKEYKEGNTGRDIWLCNWVVVLNSGVYIQLRTRNDEI